MFKTVNEEIKQQRYNICLQCDNFVKQIKTCKKCGCFMPAKVLFADTECPDNKWQSQVGDTSLINKIEEAILKLWNEEK